MPEWIVMHCLALYRVYRRFNPPLEALQQLHTTLDISHAHCREGGQWARASVYHRAMEMVEERINLVELRYGNLDRRQRYWLYGQLSRPTDHLVFVTRVDGHVFWHVTCSNVACAVKHGMNYLRQPQWVSFSVRRPDNSLVLEDITADMTSAQVDAQLAGL